MLNCCTSIFRAPNTHIMAVDLASSLNTNLSASSCRRSWNSQQNSWRRLWSSRVSLKQLHRYGLKASLLRTTRQTVTWDIFNSRLARRVHFLGLLVKDSRTRSSLRRCPWTACSFCRTQTARFLEFPIPISCLVRRWLCMILGSKTTLHCYKWLGFSELQDTKKSLFAWKRNVSTLLPPSGETVN
jgi:hypothetical protein